MELKYKQIADHYFFYTLKQFEEFKKVCIGRFGGIQDVVFVNEPDTFPSLLIYSFVNDAEVSSPGTLRVAFKHLNFDQVQMCANLLNPEVVRKELEI